MARAALGALMFNFIVLCVVYIVAGYMSLWLEIADYALVATLSVLSMRWTWRAGRAAILADSWASFIYLAQTGYRRRWWHSIW